MGIEIDQQLVQNDCGISAVKTVFNLFNVSISRDYIKEKLPTDEKGVQFIDIKNFLNLHGFNSSFKLIELNTEKDNIKYLNGLVPFIATIKKRNELHYIIVSNFTNNKVKILDPSEATSYSIGFQEFKGKIHLSHSYIKLLEIEEKLIFLINNELKKHGLEIEKALLTNDIAVLYNKVLYFSFLNDNYGFKSTDSERAFLQDLIFNLDISVIPKQFKNLKLKKEILQIESPLILSVKKNENFEANNSLNRDDENIYLKLYRSIKPSRRLWFIYIFAALFAATTAQLAVFINQILIDNVLPSFQLNILIVFAVGVGIFQLFDLVINQYKEFVAIHLSNTLDRFFLSVFDSKLNSLSISYIQSFKRGDLTERLSDSRQLKMFFVQFFTRILVDSTVALYSLCILFVISWQLSIIVLLALILFYIWFKTITPFLKTNEQIRFQKKADLFSKIIEKIDGLQVVRSFKIEHIISDRIFKSINNLLQIQTRVQYINLLNTTVVSFIVLISSLLIIIFLSKRSILYQSITLGQIITFILLSNRVFASLSRLLKENLSLQENEVILKRFFDFDDMKKPTETSNGIESFIISELALNQLSFGYHSEKLILSGVNLQILKYDKIRISGKNGSGKSTLAKVVSLLYEPVNGNIEVNRIRSSLYNHSQLRKKILLVSNDDILFNETIEFNITLGQKVQTQQIIELARQIDFYDVIAANEAGLNFVISESGKNLSTGQRKKILVLRALFSWAEVIILDEVLSGLDVDSRVKIEKALNSLNKTLVIISHEEIHAIHFNKQYIIENGRLSEL